jgi:hypothetical protein
MLHARSDYAAIQPWPTRRPHIGRVRGQVGVIELDAGGDHMHMGVDPIIPDDEPVLLIRGQDLAALATAEAWCVESERIGVDPALIAVMRQHMTLIAAWQENVAAKVADAPAWAL